jgi:hypothetical protein
MPKGLRVVAALVVKVMILISAGISISAGEVRARDRSAHPFPSVNQMAAVLPGLAGGHRVLRRSNTDLYLFDPRMRHKKLRCYATPVATHRTRQISYGDSPGYSGYPITLDLYVLKSQRRAARVMDRQRHGVEQCEGQIQDDDHMVGILRRLHVPRGLGADRVGYRFSYVGYSWPREVVLMVRNGRCIRLVKMNGDDFETGDQVSWRFKRSKAIAAMRAFVRQAG